MKIYHIREYSRNGKSLKNEAWHVPEYTNTFFGEFDIGCDLEEGLTMDDFGKYLAENEGKKSLKCLGKNRCLLRKCEDVKFSLEVKKETTIVRRVAYEVVKGPPADAFEKHLEDRESKADEILVSTPKDKILAKIGLMGFDERVTYCSIIHPPIIDVVKSDKPILNAAYKEDIHERGRDINIFPYSRVSTRIIFHSSKFEDNFPDSIQIVTRHMYMPVMQQMVSLPTNIVGRENTVRAIGEWLKTVGIESSENEHFQWSAEDIIKSTEKQKQYLELLSAEREPRKGDRDIFGLETGANFELPEEVSIYLKRDRLHIFELLAEVL
jgi:hypothetical protein